jgi:hypothetical protein
MITIWPEGSPEAEATATLLLLSDNQLSAAFAFEHLPRWYNSFPGTFISLGEVIMLVIRQDKTDPWTDLRDGKHYTVKEL